MEPSPIQFYFAAVPFARLRAAALRQVRVAVPPPHVDNGSTQELRDVTPEGWTKCRGRTSFRWQAAEGGGAGGHQGGAPGGGAQRLLRPLGPARWPPRPLPLRQHTLRLLPRVCLFYSLFLLYFYFIIYYMHYVCRLPDLGVTTLDEVVEDARRITRCAHALANHLVQPLSRWRAMQGIPAAPARGRRHRVRWRAQRGEDRARTGECRCGRHTH